jgi:chromosome segregation ATPase
MAPEPGSSTIKDDQAMEKTNSRRSGIPSNKPQRSRPESDPSDTVAAVTETVTTAADATGEGETPRGRKNIGSFQEAFLDERNDVLTVINELEDQLDRYQEIRESLERELGDRTNELQAASQKIQELEWQNVTLQTRVEALEQVKQEVTLLEEEVDDANARVQRVTEQLAAADKDNMRLTAELKSVNKQLEELWAVRTERDTLRNDTKTLRSKYETLEREQRDALDARNIAQDKLNEAEVAIEELRKARAALELDLRNSEDRGREAVRIQEELQDKIETLRNEKKAVLAQIAHYERENARLVEQRQFYECELMSLRNMNRNADAALANVKKAFAEVRVALAETKARVRRRTITTRPRVSGRGIILDPSLIDGPETDIDIDIPSRTPGTGTDAHPVGATHSSEIIKDELNSDE